MRVSTLSVARRRFNELAAAVAESREQSRYAARSTDRIAQQLEAVSSRLDAAARGQTELEMRLARLSDQIELLVQDQQTSEPATEQFRGDVIRGLRWIHADEAWHRRRLRELRETAEYESAFTEPEPLVSVIIPTLHRLELLRSRALPSVLAQTHRNLEVIVVGDDAPFDEAAVTAGFDDSRIRFTNLSVRGWYPDEAWRRWLVAGSPPFNEGVALARGSWIVPFADDDALRPHHMEQLLAHAREHRLEFAYGKLAQHGPDAVLGAFPPEPGNIGLQASLLHRDLRLFELELADADFGVPADWARIERMLRAGVRTGMIDEVVADYYPGKLGEGS